MMEDLKKFIHKPVVLTKKSGAKYAGILSSIRLNGRLCLTDLVIFNKYGAAISSKSDKKRWFNICDCISIIEFKA